MPSPRVTSGERQWARHAAAIRPQLAGDQRAGLPRYAMPASTHHAGRGSKPQSAPEHEQRDHPGFRPPASGRYCCWPCASPGSCREGIGGRHGRQWPRHVFAFLRRFPRETRQAVHSAASARPGVVDLGVQRGVRFSRIFWLIFRSPLRSSTISTGMPTDRLERMVESSDTSARSAASSSGVSGGG